MRRIDLEISFDQYRMDVARRMLWRADAHVALGNRAFAILQALLERPGVLVTKSELFERAWPGLTVDDANLRVQVANLRKALGSDGDLIVTEQSLGYSFAGTTSQTDTASASALPPARFAVPRRLEQFVGREDALRSVASALKEHRLVTVVGSGGIGKTSLAIEAARRLDERFRDGGCFVDLSLATNSNDVAAALATALERPLLDDPLGDALTFVRQRSLLIVLDCCERVVDAAAEVAERLLGHAPGLSIVATSREALRIHGEVVHQLDGLSVPPPGARGPASSSTYDAVSLFAQTASAAGGFDLTAINYEIVGDICRRIEGIPLAIDLAAGLVGVLPLPEIREGLDERFSILTLGGRRGLPRHRTLDAAIAWSYDWLDPLEAIALQRLSVFPTTFELAGAIEVIGFGALSRSAARASIVSLARKSLVTVDGRGALAQYRLLDTTRAFAREQASVEDMGEAHRNHARYVLASLKGRSMASLRPQPRERLVEMAADIREALHWSFSANEDASLPVRIATAAETVWLELAQYSEHGSRMLEARERLEREACPEPALLSAVLTGIAHGVIYAAGDEDRLSVVLEAIAVAERLGDDYRLMRNLSFAHYFYTIRHRAEARPYAERLMRVADLAGDEDVLAFARLLTAVSDIQCGSWDRARSTLTDLRSARGDATSYPISVSFGFEPASFVLFEVATLDCFQGYLDAAFRGIDHALDLIAQGQHAQTRFQVLYFGGCFLAFSCGDWTRARHYLSLLRIQARDLAAWQLMADAYEGWLALVDGRVAEGTEILRRFCAAGMPVASLMATFKLALADGLRGQGELDEAEGLAVEVRRYGIGEADVIMEGPALRALADALAERGSGFEEQALDAYARAIENARAGRALVFELPAAVGLARLLIRRGDAAAARQVLSSVIAEERDGQPLPGMAVARELALALPET